VKYLRAIKAYREEGRPVICRDETYIHSSREWDDGSGTGLKAPVSKGQRFIIVHAGNTGTSPTLNLHRAYCLNKNSMIVINRFFFRWRAKFHTECSFNIPVWFKEWRLPRRHKPQEKLIPNLKPSSVIVVDSVSCRPLWYSGSVLATGPKVRGFKPGRGRWIFKGSTRGSKAVGPMSYITACTRTLRAWNRCFVGKIQRPCFSPTSLLLRC
jgi:hypothetical protein